MFAVVHSTNTVSSRKIKETAFGCCSLVEIGKKVSRRKLYRALSKYGQDILFTEVTEHYGILPYDTSYFKATLLYRDFLCYIKSQNNVRLKVGIYDPDGRHLFEPITTEIITRAADTVICTNITLDDKCREWLIKTGICPEVVETPKFLSDCDCIFSPYTVCPCNGIIYGLNGKETDRDFVASKLPIEYLSLLSLPIHPADLLCMILREKT